MGSSSDTPEQQAPFDVAKCKKDCQDAAPCVRACEEAEKRANAAIADKMQQKQGGSSASAPPGEKKEDLGEKLSAVEKSLREAKGSRMSLDDKLRHVGREVQWVPLVDQCVNKKIDKDKYEICFFGQAKQGAVKLGSFDKWDREVPSVMLYANGQRCHGGPARSLRVQMVCGLEAKLLDVLEPSRCSYEASVAHPSVCSEEDLQLVDAELALLGDPKRDPEREEL